MFEHVTFGEPINLGWLLVLIGGLCFAAGVWVGSIEVPQIRRQFRCHCEDDRDDM